MNINITTEDIEKHLKEQILNSSLGQFIEERLLKSLNDYTFRNSIEEYVRNIAQQHARFLIDSDPRYSNLIKQAVEKYATEEFIESISNAVVSRIDRVIKDR